METVQGIVRAWWVVTHRQPGGPDSWLVDPLPLKLNVTKQLRRACWVAKYCAAIEGRSKGFEPNMYRRDWLMSIHLFFNVITAFVNAQFQIWKQMVITRCQVRRIWWVMHFFKSGFKYSSLSNMWPVCERVHCRAKVRVLVSNIPSASQKMVHIILPADACTLNFRGLGELAKLLAIASVLYF